MSPRYFKSLQNADCPVAFLVAFLALPLRIPFFVVAGTALIASGATIPYTSVFNEAARLRDVGEGVAQGLVSVISVPTVILGPALIGFLFGYTGSFGLAFGSILLFSAVAVTSSFLAGPAVSRETISSRCDRSIIGTGGSGENKP